jgi:hypothetical protein
MWPTPEAPSALPCKVALPAAWQSRIRGGRSTWAGLLRAMPYATE